MNNSAVGGRDQRVEGNEFDPKQRYEIVSDKQLKPWRSCQAKVQNLEKCKFAFMDLTFLHKMSLKNR